MGTLQIVTPDEVAKLIPPVVSQARQLTVHTSEDYEMACTFLQLVATRKKLVEETFDPIVTKAHAAHKEAVAQRKRFMDPLLEAEVAVKVKVSTWRNEEERKRQEEESRLREAAKKEADERALEEAARLEAAGEKELANMVVEAAAAAPAPVVVLDTTVPKQEGIAMRKNWKFRITNEALIPREYLSPDPVKIGAVVRAQKDMTRIPGVEVYSEDVVAVRSS